MIQVYLLERMRGGKWTQQSRQFFNEFYHQGKQSNRVVAEREHKGKVFPFKDGNYCTMFIS